MTDTERVADRQYQIADLDTIDGRTGIDHPAFSLMLESLNVGYDHEPCLYGCGGSIPFVAKLMDAGKSVLFMGNHGIMVIGPTVAQAFDELYYLEKAAEVQVLALQTGRELAIIPDEIAAKAERQWNSYPTGFSNLHMKALKEILDKEEPDYKE